MGNIKNIDFGNYQRVRTDDNKFFTQRFDGAGTTFSDDWKEQVILSWNNSTKKTDVKVDKLIVQDSLETPAITLNGSNLGTTLSDLNNQMLSKQSQIQSLNASNGTYTTALGNQSKY